MKLFRLLLLLVLSGSLPAQTVFANSFEPELDRAKVAVFIHGGGWFTGSIDTFAPFAREFEAVGYKTYNLAYPLYPMMDLQSIELWVAGRMISIRQQHPDAFLVVVGGSAGAHLALRMAPVADAIVAFNPVVNPCKLSPEQLPLSIEAINGRCDQHQIWTEKLILHGTEDSIIPIQQVRQYSQKDGFAELIEFEGDGHGFFNSDPVGMSNLVLDWLESQ